MAELRYIEPCVYLCCYSEFSPMAIKAAVAGLGRIASLLEEDPRREKPCTHAGAIALNSGLSLCAGTDISGERRELFAKKWGVPVYEDGETMLRKERPRLLQIATPPGSHRFYCELAARYGVSVVVCEKPLADTLRDAEKIAALHRSGKITILVNHERRYAGDYRKAREILASNRLGPVLGVRGTLYMGKTRRLLDVLWHDGTHLADAAMYLTGGTLKHSRTAGNLNAQSGTVYLEGILELYRELPFLLELGAGRDHLVFELEFSCERGKFRIGNGIFEIWESGESPYAEGFRSLEKKQDGFEGPTGYFTGMAADALACVLDREHIPLSSALDGLRVIRYLHSIRAWK